MNGSRLGINSYVSLHHLPQCENDYNSNGGSKFALVTLLPVGETSTPGHTGS